MKAETDRADDSITHNIDVEAVKTWDKFVRQSKKVGIREGANDARENKFQSFFDTGYNIGFQNGFEKGKSQGVLKAQEMLSNLEATEQLVDVPTKESCLLCENEELKNLPVEELKQIITKEKL